MRRATSIIAALAVAALVLAACGSDDGGGGGSAGDCQGDERFTQREVTAAVQPHHHVTSVYAVPKCPKEKYTLAFLNPGKNVTFFKAWSDGMRAAAKLYGVEFVETDLQLKYEDTVTQYQTVSARNPDVVGTLTTSGPALLARTKQSQTPVLPIDIPIEGNKYFWGVPNEKVGTLGGTKLAEAAKAKLEGDWKGRKLIWVSVGDHTCDPCMTRTNSQLAAARKILDIPEDNVVKLLDTEGLPDNAQNAFRDVLTANPDAVFAIASINDETGIGPLQAAKAAGRSEDVLVVTLGGDKFGRDALRRDTSGSIAGLVDFNGFAEGWTWVEAAIGIAEGEWDKVKPYDVHQVITKENLEKLYPADAAK